MAKGTLPSQKDEGLCLLGRARRLLLPPLQPLLMGMEAQISLSTSAPHPMHNGGTLLCTVTLGAKHSSSSISNPWGGAWLP